MLTYNLISRRSVKLYCIFLSSFIVMGLLTYFKGAVWGIIAPISGALAVADIKLDRKKPGCQLLKVLPRLMAIIAMNLLLASMTRRDSTIDANSSPITTEEVRELHNVALRCEGAWVREFPHPDHESSLYFFNWQLPWFIVNFKYDPSVILQPEISDGYSFLGDEGSFVIELSQPAHVSTFSLTRMDTKDLSMPRELAVQISNDMDSWLYVGTFIYGRDAEQTQFFDLQDLPDEKVSYVKVKVNSNWGNVYFTSLSSITVLGYT